PCADCAGIRTTLTLYRDEDNNPSRYQMRMEYLGTAQAEVTHTDSGSWIATTTKLNGHQYPLFVLDPKAPGGQQRFVHNAKNAVEMLGAAGKLPASGLNHTLIQQ